MESLKVEAYSFIDYNLALIQAVKDGWHLGELTNDNYPQKFGEYYIVTLQRDPNFEHKECEACKDKVKVVEVAQEVVSIATEVDAGPVPVVKTAKKIKKV